MNGAELIAAERKRQVEEEGWTDAHDDLHGDFELSQAAICYSDAACGANSWIVGRPPAWWPFGRECWRPSLDPIRNLVKAGALIAAEIDRLQRKRRKSHEDQT